MAALRAELRELRKWVALNYVAVVKAVKKRNRHLRGACAPGAVRPLSAVALLSTQHFFTSGTLAALSTRAEVLAQVCGGGYWLFKGAQLLDRLLCNHLARRPGSAGLQWLVTELIRRCQLAVLTLFATACRRCAGAGAQPPDCGGRAAGVPVPHLVSAPMLACLCGPLSLLQLCFTNAWPNSSLPGCPHPAAAWTCYAPPWC